VPVSLRSLNAKDGQSTFRRPELGIVSLEKISRCTPGTGGTYRNNRLTRSVDVDESKAPILKRMFELYSTGAHSLTIRRKAIFEESGVKINRAYLEQVLKSSFYLGQFVWRGTTYEGTHTTCVARFISAGSGCVRRSQQA
jgi:hypothetical protein